MADAKSREQLERDWWGAWWALDYSWKGLQRRLIGEGYSPSYMARGGLHDERTLQDYWRRDPATGELRDDAAMALAGELVDCEGVQFHIAHLPTKMKSGAPTWKANLRDPAWKRLDTLLAARIAAGVETKVGPFGALEGPDGRAQLVGAVIRGELDHRDGPEAILHLNAANSAMLGWTDYQSQRFGPGTRFDGAFFTGYANFDSTIFPGDARFGAATFCDTADFEKAIFSGGAFFYETHFAGYAMFNGATIAGEARFEGATFSQVASFDDATFSPAANFWGANFFDVVSFHKTVIGGDINFDRSTFADELRFDAKVAGAASFAGGRCEATVWFSNSEFTGPFDVSFREFLGRVWMNDVTFRGPMNFTGASFEKLVSFEKMTWPAVARDWHGAFEAAQFRSPVSFEFSGFKALAAYGGAILESELRIDDPDEASSIGTFLSERRAAIRSAVLDGKDFRKQENDRRRAVDKRARGVSTGDVRKHVQEAREHRLKQLERGCRVLKQSMERTSNKSREQLLYRFELQARRAQAGLPPGEALFSDLYRFASGYGASMVRPLIALVLLIALFGAGFFFWAGALGLIGHRQDQIDQLTALWQALDLSWANVFKPLSALSADGKAAGTLGDRLLDGGPAVAFAVRSVATLQSILAIVLAFLFALAVRRRFQIS